MSSPARVVAILGAGNVGCSLAVELVQRGVEVRLFTRSAERIAAIRGAGGITASGVLQGFAPVEMADSIDDAVRGVGVIALTVPAPALRWYAPRLASAITGDPVIWLNPGQSGGALYLAAEIARAPGRRAVRICQMTTASHTARITAPAAVSVLGLMNVSLATLPGARIDECHADLDALIPGRLSRLDSVLEVDLLNVNAVLHPAGMVCSAGWIEATRGDFLFYAQAIGPAVARVIEAIERERTALADRLGVATVPILEDLRRAGYTTADAAATGSFHAAMAASEALGPIRAPSTLDHRYLHEDVGWGLVPWMSLAGHVGVPTPTMGALTELATLLTGVDHRREGLTLEQMGLEGMSVGEIRSYVAGRLG